MSVPDKDTGGSSTDTDEAASVGDTGGGGSTGSRRVTHNRSSRSSLGTVQRAWRSRQAARGSPHGPRWAPASRTVLSLWPPLRKGCREGGLLQSGVKLVSAFWFSHWEPGTQEIGSFCSWGCCWGPPLCWGQVGGGRSGGGGGGCADHSMLPRRDPRTRLLCSQPVW